MRRPCFDRIQQIAQGHAASLLIEAENDKAIDATDLLLSAAAELIAEAATHDPALSLQSAAMIAETLAAARIADAANARANAPQAPCGSTRRQAALLH